MDEEIKELTDEVFNRTLKFLTFNPKCKAHGLVHNGRLSYALLMFTQWQEGRVPVDQSSEELFAYLIAQIQIDSKGLYLRPGTRVRENFSTDAIDIGILIDAFSEYSRKQSISPIDFKKVKSLVDTTLVFLVERSQIHNQRLWATLGLANFSMLSEVSSRDREKYQRLVFKSINNWMNTIHPDGFSPYFEKNPQLSGHSPYYHSRCVAFTLKALEIMNCPLTDYQKSQLSHAVNYMVLALSSSFERNGNLDSKRYYFLTGQEYPSLIFDLYVLENACKIGLINVNELPFEGDFLRNYLKKIITTLKDANSDKGNLNWQCDYMGVSYLAWISRIDFDYLSTLSKENDSRHPIRQPLSPVNQYSSLYKIQNPLGVDFHLITKKSPINFYGGGLQSGLSFFENFKGSLNLRSGGNLQYSRNLSLLQGFRLFAKNLKNDFKWLVLFFRQFLVLEHDLRKSKILLNSYKSYLTSHWKLSTQFDCNLQLDEFSDTGIRFKLNLCNLEGTVGLFLGYRTISVTNNGVVVSDNLMENAKQSNSSARLSLQINSIEYDLSKLDSKQAPHRESGFDVIKGVRLVLPH